MMEKVYRDRVDAGRRLATLLSAYAHRQDVLVLGLPRGGMPVAYEVASALAVPLDVFLVRKLGVPGQEELAMGAIATGGIRVLNRGVVDTLHIPTHVIDSVAAKEQRELERREHVYRGDRSPPDIRERVIILVDDGMATGATMLVATRTLQQENPARLVIAVPVAASATCHELRPEVDDIICAYSPDPFYGVGWWYEDFSQTLDVKVHDLLGLAQREQPVTTRKY